ncbi:bacterioferritin-associated ferredoxin [Pseudomonadota bacterium]
MYICICKAVNDNAIKEAVSEGVSSFRDLSAKTGCGTQCGSCVKLAREVMDQALLDIGSPKSDVKLEVVSRA